MFGLVALSSRRVYFARKRLVIIEHVFSYNELHLNISSEIRNEI
jgi:hypothetical protein